MTDLISVEQATKLIASGLPALVAGDPAALRQLPKGRWIGGTITHFMTGEGGVVDRDRVFLSPLPEPVIGARTRVYDETEIDRLPNEYPAHGCSFIILPSRSSTGRRFALESSSWPGLLNAPLVGWNAGSLVKDGSITHPLVFDGTTRTEHANAAVVLHVELPSDYVARIEIINPFRQSSGDTLGFPRSDFLVTDCFVNGTLRNFAEYLTQVRADARWPLVADSAGAQLNVSIDSIDLPSRSVRLYAPVIEGVEYRLGTPIGDLADFFGKEFASRAVEPVFSCNCILNYLHGGLEGKRTGDAVGPFTFGEIAYVQLNQTLVYVTFDQVESRETFPG